MGDSSGGREREMRERDWDRERLLMSDSKEGHRSVGLKDSGQNTNYLCLQCLFTELPVPHEV